MAVKTLRLLLGAVALSAWAAPVNAQVANGGWLPRSYRSDRAAVTAAYAARGANTLNLRADAWTNAWGASLGAGSRLSSPVDLRNFHVLAMRQLYYGPEGGMCAGAWECFQWVHLQTGAMWNDEADAWDIPISAGATIRAAVPPVRMVHIYLSAEARAQNVDSDVSWGQALGLGLRLGVGDRPFGIHAHIAWENHTREPGWAGELGLHYFVR